MNLSKYLPRYYQEIADFCSLWQREEESFTTAQEAILMLSLENAVATASEESLIRWEQLFGIDPLGNLVQRKMFVLGKLRGQGVLNSETINRIVNAFTGAEKSALVDFVDSKLRVRVLPPLWGDIYIFAQIEEALQPRIPAHIRLVVEKYYYSWQDIKAQCQTWQAVSAAYPTWESVKLRLEETGNA